MLTGPSAVSTNILFKWWELFATVIGADPLHYLGDGQRAFGFMDCPLAMHPAGLDSVQPRAFARQAAGYDLYAIPNLGPAIMRPDPGSHSMADMPVGIDPEVLSRC
ncbi:hypothetical protein GCM10027514_22670 [Azotobacter armeniacus]